MRGKASSKRGESPKVIFSLSSREISLMSLSKILKVFCLHYMFSFSSIICHISHLPQIRLSVSMALVDSEVVFKARCDEIGVAEDTCQKLRARGWSTFGSFAFSVSTNPSQISDDDFEAKLVVPILVDANHRHAAKLRRLLFESYTMTASELKRRAESTESDTPKKLASQ